jgi:CheY-like chemotaxis protein
MAGITNDTVPGAGGNGRVPAQAPAPRRVLVVAVTGYGQDEDRRRSGEAGFDHHLTKPLDPDTLHALLAS